MEENKHKPEEVIFNNPVEKTYKELEAEYDQLDRSVDDEEREALLSELVSRARSDEDEDDPSASRLSRLNEKINQAEPKATWLLNADVKYQSEHRKAA